MRLVESHEQLSPEDEMCDLCAMENRPGHISPFTEYHVVMTDEGMQYNVCDEHYYTIATLQ